MCSFMGPKSGARPGRCTGTAGYLGNQEIRDIIKENPSVKQFRGDDSSNILVYNNTEWVAWMNDEEKEKRTALYKQMNFGGIADWAISLDEEGLVPPKEELVLGDDDKFPTPQYAVDPKMSASCKRNGREELLREAWAEAGTLSKSLYKWLGAFSHDYQEAMDKYMGPKTRKIWLFDSPLQCESPQEAACPSSKYLTCHPIYQEPQ
jgi:hypothetical protein